MSGTSLQQHGCENSSNKDLLPMETLTNEALPMCDQKMSKDTSNAIGSQEFQGGHTPLDSQESPILDLFGRHLSLANPGQLAENRWGKRTKDILLYHSSRSRRSVNLQLSLESRLQARMPYSGLTGFSFTWKARVTPARRRICALRALAKTTAGNEFTGVLPTPCAREGKDKGSMVMLARMDRGGCVARRICALSLKILFREDYVILNPSFAGWMMGFPEQWGDCGATAMQSCLPSPPNSSEPSVNP